MDWTVVLGAVLDALREAVLVGLLATAVFCAVAGVAVAQWAALPWWLGLVTGAVLLYGGLAVLLVVGAVRALERRRAPATVPVPGVPPLPPVTGSGVRRTLRRAWRRWTRTPPTRVEWVVAVLVLVVAVALVVATQVSWLSASAAGHDVTGVGPFALQLGLFVVLSAVAALVCGLGVLRGRSAWWPVMLAWFGTWWALVTFEVTRSEGAVDALNRLLRDQVRDRFGYDVRPRVDLGIGWTLVAVLAAAMLVLAVVLLVLQGRGAAHYRLVAGSPRPDVPAVPVTGPPHRIPRRP